MNRFEACLGGAVVSDDGEKLNRSSIESLINSAVEELEKLKAEDIDASTNLRTGRFQVIIGLDADDPFTAQTTASDMIRSAFHAAGAGTPGWSVNWIEVSVVLSDDQELAGV